MNGRLPLNRGSQAQLEKHGPKRTPVARARAGLERAPGFRIARIVDFYEARAFPMKCS